MESAAWVVRNACNSASLATKPPTRKQPFELHKPPMQCADRRLAALLQVGQAAHTAQGHCQAHVHAKPHKPYIMPPTPAEPHTQPPAHLSTIAWSSAALCVGAGVKLCGVCDLQPEFRVPCTPNDMLGRTAPTPPTPALDN